MSLIQKEIDKIVSTVTLSPAVYKMRPTYGQDVRLEPISKFTINSDSMFADNVKNAIEERLDKNIGHKLSLGDAPDYVRSRISSNMLEFLQNWQDCKKPKLTTLYKWYCRFGSSYKIKSCRDFEDALFNITKYINDNELKPGDVHVKNGLGLLMLLKDRYEKKGWTL